MFRKRIKMVVVGMAGIFFLGTLPAYAIVPGLRAARTAMVAKKAKDKMAESQESEKVDKNSESEAAKDDPAPRRRRLLSKVLGTDN